MDPEQTPNNPHQSFFQGSATDQKLKDPDLTILPISGFSVRRVSIPTGSIPGAIFGPLLIKPPPYEN